MSVARAILDDLTPAELAELAERLRPYLTTPAVELLTPTDAAARLGIHCKTLTRAAAAGRVPGAERVGAQWRFRADLLRLDPPERTVPAAPKAARAKPAATKTADAIRGAR